jgi:hypothetical protein
MATVPLTTLGDEHGLATHTTGISFDPKTDEGKGSQS